MKYLPILFIFVMSFSNTYAEDYELTVFSIHNIKSVETLNNYKFTIAEAQGNWQDNFGDYGKSTILYYLETVEKKNVNIKGLAIFTDENNERFWFQANRKYTLEDAGVGTITFLDATEKYKFLVGLSCPYAIRYFEDRSYIKVKCSRNN